MPIAPSHVYLYGAVQGDYMKCFAAADATGIPYTNVVGEFSKAWRLIQNGEDLVIAVGGAALYALYYNACGWSNPNGEAGGHTPFEVFPSGHGVDSPKADYFVNAAGFTAIDSLKLAVMMSYYAVHGTFPSHWYDLPTQETPRKVCIASSSPNLTGGSASISPSTPPTKTGRPAPSTQAGGVGVYASFTSTIDVQRAIQMGWKGIAATGALGTPDAPYTRELPSQMDRLISEVLSKQHPDAWWVSFWTVSWPAGGDSFYQGGYKAGQYAGKTILGYGGSVLPNAIVIDPEGYNTPASTDKEWSDWIRGWADGLAEVDASLRPGFYCNQYQYKTFDLAAINLPAYIAVSPILGNTPEVKGGNVEGYNAYYAGCPAGPYVNQVSSWGGKFSTVQFRDSGVDCNA